MCYIEDSRMRKIGGKGRGGNRGCGLILCESAIDHIAKALAERQHIDRHEREHVRYEQA